MADPLGVNSLTPQPLPQGGQLAAATWREQTDSAVTASRGKRPFLGFEMIAAGFFPGLGATFFATYRFKSVAADFAVGAGVAAVCAGAVYLFGQPRAAKAQQGTMLDQTQISLLPEVAKSVGIGTLADVRSLTDGAIANSSPLHSFRVLDDEFVDQGTDLGAAIAKAQEQIGSSLHSSTGVLPQLAVGIVEQSDGELFTVPLFDNAAPIPLDTSAQYLVSQRDAALRALVTKSGVWIAPGGDQPQPTGP